jgi:hypothetical protein
MKRAFLLSAALAILAASPAAALTLDQAQAELAGMYCDGSKCVSYAETSVEVDLPDIPVVVDLPDTSYRKAYGGTTSFKVVTIPPDLCSAGYDWACDGAWNQPLSDGIRYRTVIVDGGTRTDYLDGGTETVFTCTRTKKVLSYNGPYTDRAGAWSIETTVASLPGNC